MKEKKQEREDDLQEEEEGAWDGWIDGLTVEKLPTEPLCCDNIVVSVLQDDWEWNHYLFLNAGGMNVCF